MRGKRPYIQSTLGPRKGKVWQASSIKPLIRLCRQALGRAGQQQSWDYEPKPTVRTWIPVRFEGLSMVFFRSEDASQRVMGPHPWDGLRMKMPV